MSPETLLAMTGEVVVAVRAKDMYDVRDLVRMKKISAGMEPYHEDYDLNKDGVVDDADIAILRKILLGAV